MCAPAVTSVFSARTRSYLYVFCAHPQVFVRFLCAPTGFCTFSVRAHRFLCLSKFEEFQAIFDFPKNFRKLWYFRKFHKFFKIFRKSCENPEGQNIKWADIFSPATKNVKLRCYSDVSRRDLSIATSFESIRGRVQKIWSDLGLENPLLYSTNLYCGRGAPLWVPPR